MCSGTIGRPQAYSCSPQARLVSQARLISAIGPAPVASGAPTPGTPLVSYHIPVGHGKQLRQLSDRPQIILSSQSSNGWAGSRRWAQPLVFRAALFRPPGLDHAGETEQSRGRED